MLVSNNTQNITNANTQLSYMCHCQQYKYLMCCQGNRTMHSLLLLFFILSSYMCHCQQYGKCPILLSDFSWTQNFLTDFHNKSTVPNFTKIHPVGAKLIHVDRWRDRHDKANRHTAQLLWMCLTRLSQYILCTQQTCPVKGIVCDILTSTVKYWLQ
jgi:hypothetical protein